MKINNFYFSPFTFNLVVNVKRPSVTDKTFFRPDINSVRSMDTGSTKKHLYHFNDGKYDVKKDLSALSHFPERTEVQEMVDILQQNINATLEKDVEKKEIEADRELNKQFKQAMIDSVSNKVVESPSVASET